MSLHSAMWKVNDLVLVEQHFLGWDALRVSAGVVIDVCKEKSIFGEERFFYYTLVDGEILRIGSAEYAKIVRRITDTSEEFWGSLKK